MLKDTKLEHGFSLKDLAHRTDGLSGSDLKELCRNAAMIPMREFMRAAGQQPHLLEKAQNSVQNLSSTMFCRQLANLPSLLQDFELRPLSLDDFFQSDGTSALPAPDPEDILFARLRG